MTDRPPLLYPGPRVALLRRIAALTIDDLHLLDTTVRELAAGKTHRDVAKGYFFAWWDGPRLAREHEDELQDLFAAVLAALARGLTGIDVEMVGTALAPRPSILDGLLAAFRSPRRSQHLQDTSIGLIESAVAPWDPRLAVVATWNMACAVALRDHLGEPTRTTLEAGWRQALGDLPA